MTFFFLSLKMILQLDSYEISEGKALKVNVSEPKTRLFLGNIPKLKGKDEIEEECTKIARKFVILSLFFLLFRGIIFSNQNSKEVIRQFADLRKVKKILNFYS